MKQREIGVGVQSHWHTNIAAMLILLSVMLVAACGSTSAVPAHPTSTPTHATTPTAVAIAQVKIVAQGTMYVFAPATLTVKVGTEVIWTNESNAPHTISSDTGLFNTPNVLGINRGQMYAFTFTKAGTYPYYCNIHTYMTGKIIVIA